MSVIATRTTIFLPYRYHVFVVFAYTFAYWFIFCS